MPAPESHPHAFPATRWSILARAGREVSEATRRRALEEICVAYWYPLYGFARGRGLAPTDAEDCTQSFFLHALTKELFAAARQERGKLRSFLRHAFAQHMINLRRDANRQKRGGGAEFISIDLDDAESRLLSERTDGESIEKLYEKRWAMALVDDACGVLKSGYAMRGKQAHYAALSVFLDGTDDDTSYQTAADALGLSINATRQEVHRMRQKYREALRQTIADTLDTPTQADIEAELAEMKRALSD